MWIHSRKATATALLMIQDFITIILVLDVVLSTVIPTNYDSHAHFIVVTDAFSLPLDPKRIPGIWTLTTSSIPSCGGETDSIRSRLLKGIQSSSKPATRDLDPDSNGTQNEILLKLNPDGTFKQCNEGYKEGRWMSGRWKLVDDMTTMSTTEGEASVSGDRNVECGSDQSIRNSSSSSRSRLCLVLAMNRQYYGPPYDLLAVGMQCETSENENKNENDNCSSDRIESSLPGRLTSSTTFIEGTIQKGKYIHPQRHPSFFDSPMLANLETLGPFTLQQSIATYSIVSRDDNDDDFYSAVIEDGAVRNRNKTSHEKEKIKYDSISESTFYGRKFILAFEPLVDDNTHDRLIDIRSMPLIFFQNNTFAASGSNKIIRGRFQVTSSSSSSRTLWRSLPSVSQMDDTKDSQQGPQRTSKKFTLSMQVSLFGAGRSAPGSVYSEGLGLTHDDEQTYVGDIQWENREQNQDRRLFVHGTAFYGTDLGDDARPEPSGKFTLIQDSSSSNITVVVDSNSKSRHNDDVKKKKDDDITSDPYCGGVFE